MKLQYMPPGVSAVPSGRSAGAGWVRFGARRGKRSSFGGGSVALASKRFRIRGRSAAPDGPDALVSKADQVWPKPARTRPNLVNSGQHTLADGQLRASSGRVDQNLVYSGPGLAGFGGTRPTLVELASTLAGLEQSWPELGRLWRRTWPCFAQIWRVRQTWARVRLQSTCIPRIGDHLRAESRASCAPLQ